MKTIFVSSTFQDMNRERDALREIALPIINRQAEKSGDMVGLCDLRWGVNTLGLTEEEANKKVLDICLDVLDNSSPVMIVIVGERYGWIPDGDLVKTASERKRMQLEDYDISVTALEIEYGAFFKQKNTLVYFRETASPIGQEDEAHRAKLGLLKEKLVRLTNGKIKTFSVHGMDEGWEDLQKFAETVADDVIDLLKKEWQEQENLSPEQKELSVHAKRAERESGNLLVSRDFIAAMSRFQGENHTVFRINGESGSGKTTLLSAMEEYYRKRGEYTIPLFCGYTPKTSTPEGALALLVYRMEEILGKEHEQNEVKDYRNMPFKDMSMNSITSIIMGEENFLALQDRYAALAAEFEEKNIPLYLFIDDCFSLRHRHDGTRYFFFPHDVSLQSIHIVYTSPVEEPYFLSSAHYTLTPFTKKESEFALRAFLRQENRELDGEVTKQILSLKNIGCPLYLRLVIRRLSMMSVDDFSALRTMQAISVHQQKIVAELPESLGDLGFAVIREAARRISPDLIYEVVRLLAVAPFGLTENELKEITGDLFNQLAFYNFVSYTRDMFTLRENGQYDFLNASIEQAVRDSVEDPDEYYARFFRYMLSKCPDELDDGEVSEIFLQNIVYFLFRSENAELFFPTISLLLSRMGENAFKPEMLLKLSLEEERIQIKEYFMQYFRGTLSRLPEREEKRVFHFFFTDDFDFTQDFQDNLPFFELYESAWNYCLREYSKDGLTESDCELLSAIAQKILSVGREQEETYDKLQPYIFFLLSDDLFCGKPIEEVSLSTLLTRVKNATEGIRAVSSLTDWDVPFDREKICEYADGIMDEIGSFTLNLFPVIAAQAEEDQEELFAVVCELEVDLILFAKEYVDYLRTVKEYAKAQPVCLTCLLATTMVNREELRPFLPNEGYTLPRTSEMLGTLTRINVKLGMFDFAKNYAEQYRQALLAEDPSDDLSYYYSLMEYILREEGKPENYEKRISLLKHIFNLPSSDPQQLYEKLDAAEDLAYLFDEGKEEERALPYMIYYLKMRFKCLYEYDKEQRLALASTISTIDISAHCLQMIVCFGRGHEEYFDRIAALDPSSPILKLKKTYLLLHDKYTDRGEEET